MLHSKEKELPTFVIVRHLLSILFLLIYLLPVVHPANSIGYLMYDTGTAQHVTTCDKCSHPDHEKKTPTHKHHKQVNVRSHSIAISFASTGPAASYYSADAVSDILKNKPALPEELYLFSGSSCIWQPPRLS